MDFDLTRCSRRTRMVRSRSLPPNMRIKLTNQGVIHFAYAKWPPLWLAAYAGR